MGAGLSIRPPPGRSTNSRETRVMSLVQTQIDTLAMHRPYLYRYALSKLRRTDTAEEVVQDTLMAALEALATFRGASEPRTWLTGILKHKIVDWQRREARNPLRTSATRRPDAA